MKTFFARFMKLGFLFYILIFVGCSSSNSSSNDPLTTSIIGTWSLKSIQCLSVSASGPCWKNLLIPLGAISMQDISTSLLTINSDGSFVGDEIPKIDTLPKEIFNCKNNHVYVSSQHIEGMYSANNGNMIITVTKYNDGFNDLLGKYIQPVSAAYTISGSTMTLLLTLAGGEKWQVIFIK